MILSGKEPAKKRVIVCSSAWKECFSPSEANKIIVESLESHRESLEFDEFSLSDGGDGWLDTMALSYPDLFVKGELEICGPVPGQEIMACYLYSADKRLLLIEAAEIHGMRRLPDGKRSPMTATSYGVGEAFMELLTWYPETEEIILSVGGSASIDGGTGFLQAIGWKFFDSENKTIETPIGGGMLQQIQRVEEPSESSCINLPEVTLLVDVNTHYVDAPRIFGPQKGASPEDIIILTKEFERIALLLDPSERYKNLEGIGAAGGLPFAVHLGCPNVSLQSGIEWTAEVTGLNRALPQANLIITGEGCFDETSLLGKGTGYLLKKSREYKIPIVVLCGQSSFQRAPQDNSTVIALYPADYQVSRQDLSSARERLKQVINEKARELLQDRLKK